MIRWSFLHLVLLSILALTLPRASEAQSYPSKPINIIVPVAPGGIADLVSRVFAAKLGETDNVRVTVENKTGGGGVPGTLAAAKAPADGYTLLTSFEGPLAVMPLLQKLAYDPQTDLAPIVQLLSAPNVLVVHSAVPARDLSELIAYAKANPGKLTYASQGVGSTGHLAGEMLKQQAGIDIVHVPYRGSAPAMQDLASGSVSMMFSLFSSAQPLIAEGRVRALGVTTASRVGFLQDVPTLREQGVPIEMAAWFGLLAPAATPTSVTAWLNERANTLLKAPEVQARFASQGATLPLGKAEELRQHMKAEREKFAEVITRSKISLSDP